MAEASTLGKGLDILGIFDDSHVELTVKDMAHLTGMSEASVYRYLETLRARGFITEAKRPGAYTLGLRILELGRLIQAQSSLTRIALPIMEQLTKKTGETVVLATIRGEKGICIEKVESHHTLRVTWQQGSTFALHAGATGKVLLAYLDDNEIDDLFSRAVLTRFTNKTITELDVLKEDLANIRQDGLAITDGEETLGVCAVAAPIFNAHGKILASLTVGGPLLRFTEEKTAQIAKLTTESAKEVTKMMGILT